MGQAGIAAEPSLSAWGETIVSFRSDGAGRFQFFGLVRQISGISTCR
jgi:hypothetical protein